MEKLIGKVLVKMDHDLTPAQLKKLKVVLTMQLEDYEVHEKKHEVVIYDETSDVAAYQQYFVSKKIQGLTANSLHQYRMTIDRFMRTVRKSFDDVSTNDIRLYLANREMIDHLSNASLIRERGIICRFFEWLHDEEYIARNPGKRVERIKQEKRIREAFSDFEVEQLRHWALSAKEKVVVELLLSTGCRLSELISLDLENYDRGHERISVIGKGNKQRYVYLNAKAKLAMTHYLKTKPHISGPILYGRYPGTRMSGSGVQKLVKTIGERGNVANVHPHRFRRTAATMALKRGMPIEMIMQFLGHEEMDTTLKYAMISKDELEASHRKYVN